MFSSESCIFYLCHCFVKFHGFLLRFYSDRQVSLEYFMKVDASKAHHQTTLSLFGQSGLTFGKFAKFFVSKNGF